MNAGAERGLMERSVASRRVRAWLERPLPNSRHFFETFPSLRGADHAPHRLL